MFVCNACSNPLDRCSHELVMLGLAFHFAAQFLIFLHVFSHRTANTYIIIRPRQSCSHHRGIMSSDFNFPWSKKKTPQELAKEAKRETKCVFVRSGGHIVFFIFLAFFALVCNIYLFDI